MPLFKQSGINITNKYQTPLKYEMVDTSIKEDYKKYKLTYGFIETTMNVYTLPIGEYISDINKNGNFVNGT